MHAIGRMSKGQCTVIRISTRGGMPPVVELMTFYIFYVYAIFSYANPLRHNKTLESLLPRNKHYQSAYWDLIDSHSQSNDNYIFIFT